MPPRGAEQTELDDPLPVGDVEVIEHIWHGDDDGGDDARHPADAVGGAPLVNPDVVQPGSFERAGLLGGIELVEVEREDGFVAAFGGVSEQLDIGLALPAQLVDVVELVAC